MELRSLGASDINISTIIMGTWQAGEEMWVGIDDNESIGAIRAAFDAGITTFDTAEVYGNGHSEKIVSRALHDVRDRVIIASKVFSEIKEMLGTYREIYAGFTFDNLFYGNGSAQISRFIPVQ